MDNNIQYRNGYFSIRWRLWTILFVVWVSFSYLYFYLYQQNYYNFYLPSQQEQSRLTIDSSNIKAEINRLKTKLGECYTTLEHDEVEIKGISRIRNNFSIEPFPKKGDKFYLRGDTTYQAIILRLDDDSSIGDTLFYVLHKPTNKIYYCKLRLHDEEWAKVSKDDPNSSYSIMKKLSENEDIIREELENLHERQKSIKNMIKSLSIKQNILSTTNILNFFDFLIFSANIHTTLGFNGILPISTLLRFICILHKLIVLYLYYLLYTKYKEKKIEE
jgi:hypothetical protein